VAHGYNSCIGYSSPTTSRDRKVGTRRKAHVRQSDF